MVVITSVQIGIRSAFLLSTVWVFQYGPCVRANSADYQQGIPTIRHWSLAVSHQRPQCWVLVKRTINDKESPLVNSPGSQESHVLIGFPIYNWWIFHATRTVCRSVRTPYDAYLSRMIGHRWWRNSVKQCCFRIMQEYPIMTNNNCQR